MAVGSISARVFASSESCSRFAAPSAQSLIAAACQSLWKRRASECGGTEEWLLLAEELGVAVCSTLSTTSAMAVDGSARATVLWCMGVCTAARCWFVRKDVECRRTFTRATILEYNENGFSAPNVLFDFAPKF